MLVFRALMFMAVLTWMTLPSAAQVKVGLVFSLSGPLSNVGIQARDGFNLAMKSLGGRLGDVEAKAVLEDDEQKPEVAAEKIRSLIEREKIDILIGPLFSDLLSAAVKPATDSGVVLISPRAGPASLASKQCNANLFVLSHQSEQLIETLGRYAEEAGLKRLIVVAADDAGGTRTVEAFKHQFLGDILAVIRVPAVNGDFAAIQARISALQPHAVVSLLSGSAGRAMIESWREAGTGEKAGLYSLVLFDQTATASQRDAMVGVFGASVWTPGLETPENVRFITEFEAEYGYLPGLAAFEAYDAAMLLDGSIRRLKGNVTDRAALRAAIKQADFKSLRGVFSFGNNNFPVQDFYVVKAEKRLDGMILPRIVKRVFSQFGDAYAAECPLK